MRDDLAPDLVPGGPPPRRRAWARGAARATPIVLGYLPVAFAYGVLAQEAGISPFHTLLMSLIVYAGASQIIAVSLIAAGAAPLSIIATTFVVNLRHSLLGSALAPHVRKWGKRDQALFAYQLTDETFAIHTAAFSVGALPKGEALALNLTAQVSWVLGSCAGILAGRHVRDVRAIGLDYALPALFIALLALQVKRWSQLVVILFSGGLAVGLALMGLDRWSVIVAAILGAALGAMLERWTKPSHS